IPSSCDLQGKQDSLFSLSAVDSQEQQCLLTLQGQLATRRSRPGALISGINLKGRVKMKPIKMLGLTALAALMAMAFIGASSAMAEDTVLCSTDPATSCTEVTHVHETSVTKAKLLTSFLTVECDV